LTGSWKYVDIVGSLDTAHAADLNTTDYANPFSVYGSAWDTGTDGTAPWRYRVNTGPGASGWNSTAYTEFKTEDPGIDTTITGLTPDTAYFVRVYGMVPSNSTNYPIAGSRYGGSFSVDGGTTWYDWDNRREGKFINQGTAGHFVGYKAHPVDNLSALGSDGIWHGGTDNRIWFDMNRYDYASVQATTDGSGTLHILARNLPTLSDGSTVDRMHLDGYALSIPEPSICALLGLGLAAFIIRRRRA
jgi:hypothetical protein